MTPAIKEQLIQFIRDENIVALYHVLQKEEPSKMNQLFLKKLKKVISNEISSIFKDKTSPFKGKVLL